MNLTLREVAGFFEIDLATDRVATGWSIDSRTVKAGDVFFALKGPNHDGHAYVAEVLGKGAIAAVVDQDLPKVQTEGVLLRVPEVLQAMQDLAAWARRSWSGEVIGITGSAGKTTTKDIVADMLAEVYPVTKNEGNLNNHVGLPLSLLRMDDNAKIAVMEMGMNHAGEIRALAKIARPRVGVVTNAGWAHIEAFEGKEGIAAAKRELIEELPANGVAVLNADDLQVREFPAPRRVLYGQAVDADVRAEDVEYSLDGVSFRVGKTRFESSLTGRHSVSNILAGIAVAELEGIEPSRLTARVKNLKPGKMRGERFFFPIGSSRHNGILVYNDCYNSNPDAARAMLDVLKDAPARRRIAVLGEMLELGRWAEPLHRDVGNYAAVSGIDVLIGIRGAARHMLDAARSAGLGSDAAYFFDDPRDAGHQARQIAQPGDAILFKGSRGVRVELAFKEFLREDR
jgi:UDP-N-acetylmuramoyl-tripeptide--D-alanyl-D-alanine ligase